MSLAEMQRITEDQIKAQNEQAMFNKQRQEKKQEEEAAKAQRVPLDQRFKNMVLGDKSQETNLLQEKDLLYQNKDK